jgi:hypothetical protein
MLTSWLGPADLRTMSAAAVQRDILGYTHQDGPYDLLAPSFNLTSCRMDSTAVYGELKSLVVRLASDTIHQMMFMELPSARLFHRAAQRTRAHLAVLCRRRRQYSKIGCSGVLQHLSQCD